jgi:hypothetical protein
METIMLKKITFAMLMSGLLLAPIGASAEGPYPDQSDSIDRGIQIAKGNDQSPFPDQSDSIDHGIQIAKGNGQSPFPDQADSIDHGIRVAV